MYGFLHLSRFPCYKKHTTHSLRSPKGYQVENNITLQKVRDGYINLEISKGIC